MAAGWTLVACLVTLREEFNELAPNRSKASDGSKGDDAHADRVSDHNPDETGNVPIRDADSVNEVHAIDIDKDLNEPGLDMEDVVQFILARCRADSENRLRYIIYNRRIWSASNGWRQKPYSGANAHTEHAHFSASYESKHEASTASWHLEDIPVALTADDKKWIRDQIDDGIRDFFAQGTHADGTPTSRIGRDAWAQGVPNGLIAGHPRSVAWQALVDIGEALADIQTRLAKIAEPKP